MRFFARLILCAGMAVAVAGCDPVTDRQYVREGVGVELGYSRLNEVTASQEDYIDYICQQAGYSALTPMGRISSCMDNQGWTAFVQADMNDIDRRCDAYLSWLDAKRRDREPVLRQFAAASAAAHSILTVSGAGTDSLNIVSTAFGLAAASYANWNSRLLLEVNQSTVQNLIYSRQTDFRNAIAKEAVQDRPRAIYLLRNYIRICLPITIETDINTSITLVQRGDPMDAKKNPVVQTAALQLDVYKPTPSTPPPVAFIFNPTPGTVEETLSFQNGIKIQKAICTKADGNFGPPDSETRKNLQEFKAGFHMKKLDTQKGVITSGIERSQALRAVRLAPNCKKAKFASAYEVGAFTKLGDAGIRKMLTDSLAKVSGDEKADATALATKLKSAKAPAGYYVVSDDIRDAIGILRKQFKEKEGRTIDYEFLDKLFKDTELPVPAAVTQPVVSPQVQPATPPASSTASCKADDPACKPGQASPEKK